MTALTNVPLTITPEAAAHVSRLGMQAELERMLEHARQCVPELRRIEVVLAPPYDTGDEDSVLIEAIRTEPPPGRDLTQWEWGDWVIQTFPPDVWRHFTMLVLYEAGDAG